MTSLVPGLFGFAIVGVVMALLIGPSRRGDLERNGRIGIRTRHTLASDAAWDAGHRAAVPGMVGTLACCGSAILVGVVLLIAFGDRLPDLAALAVVLGGYGAVLLSGVPTVRAANRAARAAG
ncbi:SdpI family protein [Microbacterium sp. NPDC055683]